MFMQRFDQNQLIERLITSRLPLCLINDELAC